jgi:hypothetical protein
MKTMLLSGRLGIFFLVFFIITVPGISAQTAVIAKPGPQGIFLMLGKRIPCGTIIQSYKIERRMGDTIWKPVAEVRTPVNFTAFKEKLEAAKALLPSLPVISGSKLQQLYDRALMTGTMDSLKGMMVQNPVKIALGLIYHDSAARTGIDFQYRVVVMDPEGNFLDTSLSMPVSMPYQAVYDDIQPVETSRDGNTVYIKWQSLGKNPAPLFMVHRKEKEKSIFSMGTINRYSVNDTTYYTISDSVSAEKASEQLQYFLTPFDHWGNAGKASQMVVLTTDNFNRAYFMSAKAIPLEGYHTNRILWTFSDPVTTRQFEIYRSESEEKGFLLIGTVSNDKAIHLDEQVWPGKHYYYYIKAISKSGKRFKKSTVFHPE